MKKIQRALVSVWRHAEVLPFVEQLRQHGIEILSTGGTAAALTEHGLPVTAVETVTGVPAMLGGRVKTLHPHLHGGILAQRDDAAHMAEVAAYEIPLIDLVVVDLYPFEAVIQRDHLPLAEALEYIDIGGVAMLRAAAKNFAHVTVVCDPRQYDTVLGDLRQHEGATSDALRQRLAFEAFQRTATYDQAIQEYLHRSSDDSAAQRDFAAQETLVLHRVRELRYGENPHQRAVW
jgi:phosphoribosylaminoimidazolecarboxamide formyltransferase/IMP cyclohydrolase